MSLSRRQNNAAATLQQLHGKLAGYIWECQGWQGLGQASQHYARGKDMTGFAAGKHHTVSLSKMVVTDALQQAPALPSCMMRNSHELTDCWLFVSSTAYVDCWLFVSSTAYVHAPARVLHAALVPIWCA